LPLVFLVCAWVLLVCAACAVLGHLLLATLLKNRAAPVIERIHTGEAQ
jgi:hypothetical protein